MKSAEEILNQFFNIAQAGIIVYGITYIIGFVIAIIIFVKIYKGMFKDK